MKGVHSTLLAGRAGGRRTGAAARGCSGYVSLDVANTDLCFGCDSGNCGLGRILQTDTVAMSEDCRRLGLLVDIAED